MVDQLDIASSVEPFWDQYTLKVDSKGRISTPTEDRGKFQGAGGGFLVWMEDHIGVMRRASWEAYFKAFKEDTAISSEMLRVLSSRASTFKLDPQGRLAISQKLRDRAGITDSVLWVGFDTYVCLYGPEAWKATEERNTSEKSALHRKIRDMRVP